jgi:hypothetical protein
MSTEIFFMVETRRRGNRVPTRQRRGQDAGASRLHSHAGAWEREKGGLRSANPPYMREAFP